MTASDDSVTTGLDIETEESNYGASDALVQSAARERQLQGQLDKMSIDLDLLHKEFNEYKQMSAPLWENELKQRESKTTVVARCRIFVEYIDKRGNI